MKYPIKIALLVLLALGVSFAFAKPVQAQAVPIMIQLDLGVALTPAGLNFTGTYKMRGEYKSEGDVDPEILEFSQVGDTITILAYAVLPDLGDIYVTASFQEPSGQSEVVRPISVPIHATWNLGGEDLGEGHGVFNSDPDGSLESITVNIILTGKL